MKGGIYSRQRCSVCGSLFIDTGKELTCPNHPEITTNRLYVKFGNVYHRFKSYEQASRFLTGLRFKSDEKTLDERDYRRDNPLGFISMSERYLVAIKPKTAKNNRSHIHHAQNYFQNKNVKDLKCGDFEDFLNSLTLDDKTKHNINSTLHVFYKWWKRACDNLKIEGIDLYGGTTHSTVRALKRYYSPEQIKAASMRKTNKAFKHYLGQAEDDEILSIYKQGSATQVLPLFKGVKNAK